MPRRQQHQGQNAEGVVNSHRHFLAAGFDRLLQPADAFERVFVTGHGHCLFGQRHRIARMLRKEFSERGFSGGMIAHRVFQRQADALQAGPAGIFFVELADVVEATKRLFPLEHLLHFVEFLDQVGAAEFHLLAGAARTG